jgi:hypothetical protein
MEPDVRMASYWGQNSRAEFLVNRANPAQATPAILTAVEAAIDTCGNNWAIDLENYIAGVDSGYGLACAAFGSGHRAGTDVLVVRRASENEPASLVANRLYLQTSRIQGTLFLPSCANPDDPACLPAGYAPPASRTHELIATAYYISNDSTGLPGVPSLRRKRLVAGGILDEEVIPGVEDLQLRFGVDGPDADTDVDQYVAPGAVPANSQVMSATIWLRIRSIDREQGHIDGRRYQPLPVSGVCPANAVCYGNTPAVSPNDNFRRIVVSKTIELRNRRTT